MNPLRLKRHGGFLFGWAGRHEINPEPEAIADNQVQDDEYNMYL